jgi:small-conductance mechanosensitive channel
VRQIAARFALLVLAVAATAQAPSSIRAEDITDYLEKSISWYRNIQTVEQNSSDVLLRQTVHQTSLKALDLAFDFARAEAGLIAPRTQAENANSAAPQGNLQQAAAKSTDRIANLQSRLTELDDAIRKAPARKRAELEAQRKELNTEMDLAKQIQDTIQALIAFSGNLGSGKGGGLTGQIDELERSVPEAAHQKGSTPAAAASAVPANAAQSAAVQPESNGIVGLAGDLFTLHDRRSRFVEARKQTDALTADINRLRAPLVDEVRNSTRRADEITTAQAQTPADPAAAERELTDLTGRFKQISKALVPLSEQGIAVGSTRGYLQESIDDLDQQWTRAGRALVMRAVMLGVVIFIILLISEFWRRATFRYVGDARRRRQFLMLRRVVVAGAVMATIILSFVTEFGSLATYAGFVTAGLAVALQNPILSVVAYFFLIGRYGIRVGDRVTISGVTGEVIEIGLVRIYLLELASDLHSTGRVVVFSNSVIFQPAAVYKQMPGLDYVWHTVKLTLSGDSDFQLAQAKLSAAVDSVYQQSRELFERQHRTLEQSVDFSVSVPRPESHLRFTEQGMEFVSRYPAEMKQATATDDRVTKALYDAIAAEPKLNFAPSGTPKVQLAA